MENCPSLGSEIRRLRIGAAVSMMICSNRRIHARQSFEKDLGRNGILAAARRDKIVFRLLPRPVASAQSPNQHDCRARRRGEQRSADEREESPRPSIHLKPFSRSTAATTAQHAPPKTGLRARVASTSMPQTCRFCNRLERELMALSGACTTHGMRVAIQKTSSLPFMD